MSEKPLIHVVAAVIVNDNGQILITQRPINSHLGGMWEFPGGKVDATETPQKALEREIMEELGVEIVVRQLLWQERFTYPEKNIDIQFFACQLKAKPRQIKAIEVADFRWITIDQFNQFQFPPADDTFIKKLKEEFIALLT